MKARITTLLVTAALAVGSAGCNQDGTPRGEGTYTTTDSPGSGTGMSTSGSTSGRVAAPGQGNEQGRPEGTEQSNPDNAEIEGDSGQRAPSPLRPGGTNPGRATDFAPER